MQNVSSTSGQVQLVAQFYRKIGSQHFIRPKYVDFKSIEQKNITPVRLR